MFKTWEKNNCLVSEIFRLDKWESSFQEYNLIINGPWVYPEAHSQVKYKKNFMALFIDGVQLSQGYRATTRRQFTFYHSNGNGLLNTYFILKTKFSISHSRGPYQRKLIMTFEKWGQKFSF